MKQTNYQPHYGAGGLKPLSAISSIYAFKPYHEREALKPNVPKRKYLEPVEDNGTFIKPLKQSFMRNPRLSPMTRIMLSLLAGWNGAGVGGIKTTMSTIGNNLSRTRRMVFNYLQEAIEEGYLTYSRIKDKMGYYIGIKITLNFGAIRKTFKRNTEQNVSELGTIRDVKYPSQINNNLKYNLEEDQALKERLTRFALELGYISNTGLDPSG